MPPRTLTFLAAVVAAPLVMLCLPPGASAQVAPSVTVGPSDDLVDGQIVTLTGTGFVPNSSVARGQCPAVAAEIDDIARLIAICSNIDTAGVVDAGGNLTAEISVLRQIAGGVDCADEPCIILLRDLGSGTSGSAPLGFRAGPLAHTASVDPDVDLEDSQDVTVSGSGFTPDLAVSMGQCPASASGVGSQVELGSLCGGLVTATPDAQGSFTTAYPVSKVRPTIIDGGTVRCGSAPGDCFLLVLQSSSARRVELPITFASLTQQPRMVADSTCSDRSPYATSARFEAFPANETFEVLLVVYRRTGNEVFEVVRTFDESGSSGEAIDVPGSDPQRIGAVVYRDVDASGGYSDADTLVANLLTTIDQPCRSAVSQPK